MAFYETIRLERKYFENLRSLIDTLNSWLPGEEPGKIQDLLANGIEANKAILLLYRNLGECWNDLTSMIAKTNQELGDLKVQVEQYHDELNEKIDEVNNYLMALIRDLESRVQSLENRMDAVEARLDALEARMDEAEAKIAALESAVAALEARVTALEAELQALNKNIVLECHEDEGVYTLTEYGKSDPVTYAQVSGWLEHPHLVYVIYESKIYPMTNISNDELQVYEWSLAGMTSTTVDETTITLDGDNYVDVILQDFDYAALTSRVSANETNISNAQRDITTINNILPDKSDGESQASVTGDAVQGYTMTKDGDPVTFADLDAIHDDDKILTIEWDDKTLVLTDYTAPDPEQGIVGGMTFETVYNDNGVLKRDTVTIHSDGQNDSYEQGVVIPTGGDDWIVLTVGEDDEGEQCWLERDGQLITFDEVVNLYRAGKKLVVNTGWGYSPITYYDASKIIFSSFYLKNSLPTYTGITITSNQPGDIYDSANFITPQNIISHTYRYNINTGILSNPDGTQPTKRDLEDVVDYSGLVSFVDAHYRGSYGQHTERLYVTGTPQSGTGRPDVMQYVSPITQVSEHGGETFIRQKLTVDKDDVKTYTEESFYRPTIRLIYDVDANTLKYADTIKSVTFAELQEIISKNHIGVTVDATKGATGQWYHMTLRNFPREGSSGPNYEWNDPFEINPVGRLLYRHRLQLTASNSLHWDSQTVPLDATTT